MSPQLEQALNRLAALRGLPTVQSVLNRAGAAKRETGKLLPFKPEPRPYWTEKD